MIIIEKPVIEDVKGIQAVLYETWLDTYPNREAGITKEDIEERFKMRFSVEELAKREKSIRMLTSEMLFLAAKEDGRVVGICRAIRQENVNQLGAIYVLPDYQRQGIGHAFWKRVAEFLGPEKDIIVNVVVYNEKAINFYKKVGFVDTGKRFIDEHFKMPVSGAYLPEMELVKRATR
jgi:GNAT superfamily N-acetyltransferase